MWLFAIDIFTRFILHFNLAYKKHIIQIPIEIQVYKIL
jgi:hypothetical protein